MINAGSISKLLRPGVNAMFGLAYNMYPEQYSQIFTTETSEMGYEEDVNMYGFGMGATRSEGGSVSYDVMGQGYVSRYTHVEFALGFVISRIAIADNLYMKAAKAQSQALAIAMKTTKETIAANVLNRAFNNSYLGGDGVCLGSASHLLSKGGTFANIPSVAVDLSEASIEQGLIAIDSFTDDAGLQMAWKGDKLIVPPSMRFEAARILNSSLQNDTANNAVNAMMNLNMLPGGFVVNNYLTDTDAWFIKTSCPQGLKHFMRQALELTNETEFDSDNVKFKATERYSFGWSDPRCIYASAGA